MAIGEFLSGVRERVTVTEETLPPDVLADLEQGARAEIEAADAELDGITADPAPAHKSRKTRAKPGPKPKATATQKKDVTDALTMMIEMPAAVLSFKDPVCAGAVLSQSDEVIKKLVPIVCRNPRLLEWFTTGAGYMDWFGLATALFPIVKTVWQHHVAKPHDHQEGGQYAGNPPDFSHYTAPDLAA